MKSGAPKGKAAPLTFV